MKASLKAMYQTNKGEAPTSAAAVTVTFNAGDLKLRATLTDATIVKGPSLNGLGLAVEKPGFFIVDYNVPNKDVKSQFMNSIKVAEKQVDLTYTHSMGDNKTALNGTLVLDSANKLAANHVLGTANLKLKYTYVQGGLGLTTFEPSYEWGTNSWDVTVSLRIAGGDLLKATYHTSSKDLGLEWSTTSKLNGSFKLAASVNLGEELKMPKLIAETTLDFEM